MRGFRRFKTARECLSAEKTNIDSSIFFSVVSRNSMAVSEEDAVICRVFFAVLCVINIIGNTLVVLSVLRNRSMQTIMNYLIVNLAIADTLVGLFLLPKYVFNYLIEYPVDVRGDIICKFFTYGAISWVGLHAQVFTLIVISVERYSAVVHPLNLRGRLTKRKLKIVLVASWLYAISFNMPYFVLLEYDYKKKACAREWSGDMAQKIWALMWLITCGPIPLFSMGYLYGKVVYGLWIKKNRVSDMSRIAVTMARKRVTKMVITVAVIYAVCWLPNLIVFNVLNYFDNISSLDLLYMISHIFLLFNSSVNPFVYSIQSQYFRKAMMESLCFWKQRNSWRESNSHVMRVMSRNRIPIAAESGAIDCNKDNERRDNKSHAATRKENDTKVPFHISQNVSNVTESR